MIKKISFCLVITSFLGGCAQKGGIYHFDDVQYVKVDESTTVLSQYPSGIKEIDDSLVAGINSDQKLSLYNIYTGKNINNFSTGKTNFDSLIGITFRKKYAGRREYTYNPADVGGITNDGNAQLSNFYYANDTFYIFVSVLTKVKFVNDSIELAKYTGNEKIKAATSQLKGPINFNIMDYLTFMFVADKQLHLKTIIPLYDKDKFARDHYSPLNDISFAVNDNHLFSLLLKDNESYEKMSSKLNSNEHFYALGATKLLDPSGDGSYRLSFHDIDFKDFSYHDFLTNSYAFRKCEGGLAFSNGKEICNVESGKKLFAP